LRQRLVHREAVRVVVRNDLLVLGGRPGASLEETAVVLAGHAAALQRIHGGDTLFHPGFHRAEILGTRRHRAKYHGRSEHQGAKEFPVVHDQELGRVVVDLVSRSPKKSSSALSTFTFTSTVMWIGFTSIGAVLTLRQPPSARAQAASGIR